MNDIFFRHVKLDKNITRIWGVADEIMYLIEGDEQAVLIDAGIGIGNLREYVEKLTDKPIMLFLTHGHMDHAMGASLFPRIYMNPADDSLYKENRLLVCQTEKLAAFLGDKYDEVKDCILPFENIKYEILKAGMIFNIGGLTLEIYDAVGHTKGSVVILIKEKKILVVGDACTGNTLVYDHNSTTVEEYLVSLKKLEHETYGKYDIIYFSHGSGEGEKGYIQSAIKVCEDILNGKGEDIPYDFFGDQAYVAKDRDDNLIRYDGGLANIVYSKERIYKKDVKI